MYLVAIGWIYVVLMMAVAEALSTQGTVLGAVFTFLLYGVLPLAIVLYIMGTPGRRRARRAAEAEELARLRAGTPASDAPDRGGVAPADAVAPEREER
jgi:Na+/serine symporter